METTPAAATGRQLIESYGDGRFRISGVVYEGSVLVLPERSLAWPVAAIEEISLDSLAPVTAAAAAAAALEILLIGCALKACMPLSGLREYLTQAGCPAHHKPFCAALCGFCRQTRWTRS